MTFSADSAFSALNNWGRDGGFGIFESPKQELPHFSSGLVERYTVVARARLSR
jgi:hypothetical protein